MNHDWALREITTKNQLQRKSNLNWFRFFEHHFIKQFFNFFFEIIVDGMSPNRFHYSFHNIQAHFFNVTRYFDSFSWKNYWLDLVFDLRIHFLICLLTGQYLGPVEVGFNKNTFLYVIKNGKLIWLCWDRWFVTWQPRASRNWLCLFILRCSVILTINSYRTSHWAVCGVVCTSSCSKRTKKKKKQKMYHILRLSNSLQRILRMDVNLV